MAPHSAGDSVSAKIIKASPRQIGQKDAVEVRAETPGGTVISALIFLTPAAANMARAQLKACGFDADTQSLADLIRDDRLLAGNFVDMEAEDYNGKLQWKIRTGKSVPKSRLADHDAMLRAAKDRDLPPLDPVTTRVDQPAGYAEDDIPF